MPETPQEVRCSEQEFREGVRLCTGREYRISLAPQREASEEDTIVIKLPYEEENPLDHRLEVTLYTNDGTYNSTLVVAEQEQEGGRRVLRYEGCPPDKIYGASLAWVDESTGQKTGAWALFQDVSWDVLTGQGQEGGEG